MDLQKTNVVFDHLDVFDGEKGSECCVKASHLSSPLLLDLPVLLLPFTLFINRVLILVMNRMSLPAPGLLGAICSNCVLALG